MKKLEYRGYQFKDFFKDMIAERGFLNVDVHRLTWDCPKHDFKMVARPSDTTKTHI